MIALRVGELRRAPRVVIPSGAVRARDNGAHPGGRPPKLDQAKADLLLKFVRLGEYLPVACAAAGINDATLRRWRDRAEEEEDAGEPGPFAKLCTALKEAAGLAQTDALAIIRAGPPNWQAQAWFKERTCSHWRRRLAIADLDEPEAEDGDGIEVRVRVVTSRPADEILDVEGRVTETAE